MGKTSTFALREYSVRIPKSTLPMGFSGIEMECGRENLEEMKAGEENYERE